MTWTLRVTAPLLNRILVDLARPHSHAGERVGFVFARFGNVHGPELQILPVRYSAVADSDYIEDLSVGARIDSNAIRHAMQTSLSEELGVFHIHMHDHKGRPGFSPVDIESYHGLVTAFQNISPNLAHGALLLSQDSIECLVWLPGTTCPSTGGRIVVVGRPMGFFQCVGENDA